jgi:hypothetical protein
LHGGWFMQKYLSENIFLFKEIQFIGKVSKVALAETVAEALFDINHLLICQSYPLTPAMSNISWLTFKYRNTSPAAFCLMLT